MRRRKIALSLVLCLLLAGCWSRIEVNDVGLVLAIGVDQGESERLRLTLYMARSLARSPVGAEEATESRPAWVVAREAASETQALAQIARTSSRRIVLSHVQVVLVGEEFGRRGIRELEDFLARNPEIRMTTRPFTVRGKAQRVLETLPNLKGLQPQNLVDLLDATGVPRQSLKDFLVARISQTHTGWMHGLTLTEPMATLPGIPLDVVTLNGTALYSADNLMGWLDEEESQGLYWLLGQGKHTTLTATCPGDSAHTFSARTLESRSQIQPKVAGSRLSFAVGLRAQMELLRVGCDQSGMKDPAARIALEQLLNRVVQERVVSAVAKFKETSTDPVGFGKRVEMAQPAYWERVRGHWLEEWLQAKVTVTADLRLQSAGLLTGSPTDVEEVLGR